MVGGADDSVEHGAEAGVVGEFCFGGVAGLEHDDERERLRLGVFFEAGLLFDAVVGDEEIVGSARVKTGSPDLVRTVVGTRTMEVPSFRVVGAPGSWLGAELGAGVGEACCASNGEAAKSRARAQHRGQVITASLPRESAAVGEHLPEIPLGAKNMRN